jgi:hypothetical protein
VVHEVLQLLLQAALVPAGIPVGAEKYGPLVVVQAVDFSADLVEMRTDFGADQTRRAGH